jgi:peptidoglycan/xylan/chitin deacetylase (PgdA/CDA1 family)
MDAMPLCFTVDDVGYSGFSTEGDLARLLAFCAEEGLKATFFAVPRCERREIGRRQEYVDLLQQALESGHEVAQHGLDHDRFEFGIPPKMVLDLRHEAPARERLARRRHEIEAGLTVVGIRQRLRTGRRILESVLGQPIRGFRAPCLAICDNLFAAIEAEGYRYDSSRHLQEAGWDLINGQVPATPRPITRKKFDALQRGSVREWPLTADYTWYLTRERYAATLALAKHDFDACLAAGIPFVPICHVSPIQEGAGNCGFEFYRELLAYARRQTQAAGQKLASMTLAEVSAVGPAI